MRLITPLCALAALAGAAALPSTAAAQALAGLDHYQCYQLKSAALKRTVKLKDQFGSRAGSVSARTTLCAPVSKNGGAVKDKRSHLACYATKSKAFRSFQVTVKNQFTQGDVLNVVSVDSLCLPTGKRNPAGHPAPIPTKLDHYLCYDVKPVQPPPPQSVTLKDQFGSSQRRTTTPVLLCTPVSKDGGKVLNRRAHLVCYKLAPNVAALNKRVTLSNQFEPNATTVVLDSRTLCVPSLKRITPRKPDLTATIVGPRMQVSCPGGVGTCSTTVQFRIGNAGGVAAGPFDVLVQADPGLATTTTMSLPGLAAGASTATLSATVGPAGNCFDPDCTVRVTADSGNAVAEAVETNNTAELTVKG
jgi:hypothetical protein